METSDESLYLEATNEFESNDRDPALWAKCLSICEGDEKKAKYKYINKRVKSFAQTNKKQGSDEAKRVRQGKGFMDNLSEGNYGLAQTYWLYGSLIGILLSISSYFISALSTGLGFFVFVGIAVYQSAVLIGVWKAANKYSGPNVWAMLAKLMTIFGWIVLVGSWVIVVSILVSKYLI